MAGFNKTRTVPFRLLAYLLYGKYDWLEFVQPGVVRVKTGPASRMLRMRSADFWQYLYWLEQNRLVTSVQKETRRGTVLIGLRLPVAHAREENTQV